MTRIAPTFVYFIIALAAFPLTFAMSASPAFAQAAPYYRAEFAHPLASTQLVERGLLWSCADQACVAVESNSRDAVICSALARKLGKVTAFSAGGRAFDDSKLAACNSRAS